MAANSITLARPYARAAFENAREAGALEAVGDGLAFAAAAIAVPEAKRALGDPRLVGRDLATLLLPEGAALDSPLGRFLVVLAEARRVALLPEIAALYQAMKREHDGELKVLVRSAVALEAGERERIASALSRRFGKRIALDNEIDPDLIGGAVIHAGESVIDGSVRGRLAQLAQALAQ